MNIDEYLKDPCGSLSLPYWKAEAMTLPGSVRIIHGREWNGQYRTFQRFFRIKHSLGDLGSPDPGCSTMSISAMAVPLAEMINASYTQENIQIEPESIIRWQEHRTFREDLCICIYGADGRMAASGIAEYDRVCREGIIEWVQVLPECRRMGLGKRITMELLRRVKAAGAEFATVSGNCDNAAEPFELYKSCGFTGDDVWYICKER